MELIKIALDAMVMFMWYTGNPDLGPVGKHTKLLLWLLGGSASLSTMNVLVLYNAYKHWCTSQTKVESEQEQDDTATVVDISQTNANSSFIVEPPKPVSRMNKTGRRKQRRPVQQSNPIDPYSHLHHDEPREAINLLDMIDADPFIDAVPLHTVPMRSPTPPPPPTPPVRTPQTLPDPRRSVAEDRRIHDADYYS
jgi:hypothetical protein